MTGKSPQQPQKTEISKYLVAVKGKLAENWADLFNGVRIESANDFEGEPITVLACQVQDQAELIGILNWIQHMNLILLEVKKVREEKNDV